MVGSGPVHTATAQDASQGGGKVTYPSLKSGQKESATTQPCNSLERDITRARKREEAADYTPRKSNSGQRPGTPTSRKLGDKRMRLLFLWWYEEMRKMSP